MEEYARRANALLFPCRPLLLLHIVSQLSKLFRATRNALVNAGVRRHNLVVQILDEFGALLFEPFVVSATVWLTRAEACSTLRLKLVMKLLVMMRKNSYANTSLLFSRSERPVNGGAQEAQWRRTPTSSGRAKSSPHQTRMLRLL